MRKTILIIIIIIGIYSLFLYSPRAKSLISWLGGAAAVKLSPAEPLSPADIYEGGGNRNSINSSVLGEPAAIPSEKMTVKFYLGSRVKNPLSLDCGKVYPVERIVTKDPAVAAAALNELVRGVYKTEADKGYFTSLPNGVELRKITIENGIARADFSRALNDASGSCVVTAVRAQITETLKQFKTVKNVVISAESETESVLEP